MTIGCVAMAYFILQIIPNLFSRLYVQTLNIGAAFLTTLTILMDYSRLNLYLLLFQMYIVVFGVLGLFFLLKKLIKNQQPSIVETRYITLFFFILILTVINDVLHAAERIETGLFFHYAIVLFFLGQSFILARKFSNSFRQVEVLYEEIKEKIWFWPFLFL